MSVVWSLNDIDISFLPASPRSIIHELYLREPSIVQMIAKSTNVNNRVRLFSNQRSANWFRRMSTYVLEIDESIANTAKAKN